MSNKLSQQETEALIKVLKERFEKNTHRHKELHWPDIESKLNANPHKLWSLHQMEQTGGEPDVVGLDKSTGQYLFFDCAPESPSGRRSLCYDQEALEKRKENKPKGSAINTAQTMQVELLTEQQYRELQQLGTFDLKTSSWVQTPPDIRKLGGAVFCDRRYNTVFLYHNGADSYYAARGFRASLKV